MIIYLKSTVNTQQEEGSYEIPSSYLNKTKLFIIYRYSINSQNSIIMKILRTIRNIILRIYYNYQLHKIIDKYTWKSSIMYSVEDWEKIVKLQELIKDLKI